VRFEQVDDVSSHFDVEYRREVYRCAAAQARASVAETTWLAFQLTHVQGVSIADAAAQMGIDVGNVYIACSRVMHRVRQLAQESRCENERSARAL
jgi:DNA-directed RNA polymerase specialized sigma24 family protein